MIPDNPELFVVVIFARDKKNTLTFGAHPTKALEKRIEYTRQGGPIEAFRTGYNSNCMRALASGIYRADGHLGLLDLDYYSIKSTRETAPGT